MVTKKKENKSPHLYLLINVSLSIFSFEAKDNKIIRGEVFEILFTPVNHSARSALQLWITFIISCTGFKDIIPTLVVNKDVIMP